MKLNSEQFGKFYYHAFPMQAVLVTSRDEKEKMNILTIAWHTPISRDPPLYGISVATGRYSHSLIEKTKEFVINFMPFDLIEEIHFCGTNSGRKIDKINNIKLSYVDSKKIKTKIINEGYAHLECNLYDSLKIGDHTLFVGKVVNIQYDEDAFINNILDNKNVEPAFYLGDNTYTTVNKKRKKF